MGFCAFGPLFQLLFKLLHISSDGLGVGGSEGLPDVGSGLRSGDKRLERHGDNT